MPFGHEVPGFSVLEVPCPSVMKAVRRRSRKAKKQIKKSKEHE
jgi:hypothetical protein